VSFGLAGHPSLTFGPSLTSVSFGLAGHPSSFTSRGFLIGGTLLAADSEAAIWALWNRLTTMRVGNASVAGGRVPRPRVMRDR
jgi:hypothetical protein